MTLLVLSLLAPVLVLGGVWWPEFAHYYVPTPGLPAQAAETARSSPDDVLLQELTRFIPGFGLRFCDDAHVVAAADKLLAGRVDIAGLPQMSVTVPFSAADVDRGSGSWQLPFAGLALPDVLIRAYQRTHEDRYLFGARDMIIGWSNFEQRAWVSRGFLWNDHAMASRVAVLAEFWLAYRHHASFDPAVARTLMTFAARTGYVLASSAHFTFSTNHGVMQNLALWHLALAFPTLPDAPRYRSIAFTRLKQQMAFYIDSEGAVLEHSAGYHKLGMEFLGMALRYLSLTHTPPPADWRDKYDRARRFYAQLRLPDGFLPLIGDTANKPDPLGPLVVQIGPDGRASPLHRVFSWRPIEPYSLNPVAGFSIWWDGLDRWPDPRALNQTVITWSHFPGHGHKHADEPSVSLWAAGELWWSNVGYWRYDRPGRSQAESWSGSNAPHLVTEPASSQRSTRLAGSGWSPRLAGVHLERRGPKQYSVHRQVLHLVPNIWVVVDHSKGAIDGTSRTQWTTSPDIRLVAGPAPGAYTLEPEGSRLRMSLHLLTSPGASVRQIEGSLEPFAGWQVVNGTSKPAPALVIDHPAPGGWTILVSCLVTAAPAATPCPERADGHVTGDDDWVLTLRMPSARLALRRASQTIQVDDDRSPRSSQTLTLQPGADVAPRLEELRRAFAETTGEYPRFKEVMRYRLRVSHGILIVLLVQEVVLALPTPIKRHARLFRWLSIAGWAVLGGWLMLVYFR